jgi:hypothetical protein
LDTCSSIDPPYPKADFGVCPDKRERVGEWALFFKRMNDVGPDAFPLVLLGEVGPLVFILRSTDAELRLHDLRLIAALDLAAEPFSYCGNDFLFVSPPGEGPTLPVLGACICYAVG